MGVPCDVQTKTKIQSSFVICKLWCRIIKVSFSVWIRWMLSSLRIKHIMPKTIWLWNIWSINTLQEDLLSKTTLYDMSSFGCWKSTVRSHRCHFLKPSRSTSSFFSILATDKNHLTQPWDNSIKKNDKTLKTYLLKYSAPYLRM